MKMRFATVVLAVLAAASPAWTQTASELLQKGIYTQETLGDLDGAIKIYQQIVTTAGDSRVYAAQAQFRLGLCLLKKGDQAGARKAFEAVVNGYPEQKDLVAKAQELMPAAAKLLAPPWTEPEVLEFRMSLGGGPVVGTQVYSIERTGANTVLLTNKTYMQAAPMLIRAEVERDTMRPLNGMFKSPLLGESQVRYEGRQVRMEVKGKPPKTVELQPGTIDNEEFISVLRRLPLAPGYKDKLTVISSLGGVAVNVGFEVTGLEEVQTPAGKFRCHKVEIDVMGGQMFWIAVDPPRYLVKYEANKVKAELQAVHGNEVAPVLYRNDNFGVSLTAPAGWIFQPAGEMVPQTDSATVYLLDPEMGGTSWLWMGKAEKPTNEEQMRAHGEKKTAERAKQMQKYNVRTESWQTRRIGGRLALSCLADFELLGTPRTEYLVWVRSDTGTALFIAQADTPAMDAFRKRIDPVVETLTLR